MENKFNDDEILIENEFIKVPENPFKCKLCDRTFDRKSSWINHQRTHIDDHPKTCKVCLKGFIDRASLTRHMLTENHIAPLALKKDFPLKYKDSFSVHQEEITNQSIFKCHICNKMYSDESVLYNHLLQHESSTNLISRKSSINHQNAASDLTTVPTAQGETVNIGKSTIELDRSNLSNSINSRCINGRSIASQEKIKRSYKRRKKLRNDRASIQCKKCHKIFESSNSLSLHFCNPAQLKTYHRASKISKCNNSKEISEKTAFPEDCNVHNEELTCNACQQHFKSESDLKAHFKLHFADKFICEDCQQAFKDRRSLDLHRKIISKKGFVCWSNNLINNQKVHKDDRNFCCNICTKPFLKKFNLCLHYFCHSKLMPIFICSICFKIFNTRNNWVSHYCTHIGIKPLICHICNKQFFKRKSLHLHCRIHTDEEPYSCDICKKTFKYFNSLIMHQRNHSKKISC